VSRFCKKPDAIVSINPFTQRLIISGREGELFVQPGPCLIEGKFPDYSKVMPTFSILKLAVADHVRSNYIAEAASIHPDFGSKRFGVTNGIRLWQAEATGPVIVEYAGHPEYCGIIMPVRCEVKDTLGAWRKQFGQAEIPGLSEAA
jgi:DNA polymerase III sliding clamp (beta) subunit (PCNA family)